MRVASMPRVEYFYCVTDREAAPLLDRYLLRERIARGGMGEVFRAVAVGADGFEKPVVVKRILPLLADSDRLVRLFTSEAKLMTHLTHPNIVQVLDFGRGRAGEYFMVLELVEGMDLGRFRKSSQLTPALASYIVAQMLRGLAFAHESSQKPLVHRDVSPGNVLLSRVGEVKLADFGVALARGPEGASDKLVVGKPKYMAPEQLQGGAVDPRADLFAAGVVLFELLTNELPVLGTSPAELGAELAAFLDKALAKDPDARFQTAREMSGALAKIREQRGERVDTEDLALAVVAALEREPPTARPVVMLGASPGAGSGVLTRVTVRDRGAEFAVEMPDEGATAVDPQPPATRWRWRWPMLALAMVALASAGIFLALRAPPAPVVNVPSGPSASVTVPTPSATAIPAPSATATQIASAPPISAKRVVAVETKPVASSSASESDDCRGEVQLHSAAGSWNVSGGPFPVQAPGRYTWPCGVYSLSAVSRMDPSKSTQLSVRVKDGGTSVHALR